MNRDIKAGCHTACFRAGAPAIRGIEIDNKEQKMGTASWKLPGWRPQVTGLLLLLGLVGCGGVSDPLNRQAVSGTVTLDGELLNNGSISFDPQDREHGRSGGAVIENGKFRLDRQRGLPPGSYTVRIHSADSSTAPVVDEAMPGDSRQVARERIPAHWNSQSEQTVTVEDGGKNQFEFAIP